jgi:hypothetical protein
LESALAEQAEISKAQTALQASIAAAQTATQHLAECEGRWDDFARRDGLYGEPDTAKRAELRAAAIAAKAAVKPLEDDRAKLAELHTAGLEISRRIVELQRVVILTEAANLAEAYHYHERLALKAQAAIEGLARASIATAERHRDLRDVGQLRPGEQRDHTAAQPFIDLALTIRRGLEYGADPQASAAGRAARIDAAESYGRSVAAWVAELNADPHARLPNLEP